MCGEVIEGARVVDEGDVVTAGGVTRGIDLGLHLVGRFWGAEARTRVARQMEWGGD
jgi:transcriptional regulator GlxA family with amidase domain